MRVTFEPVRLDLDYGDGNAVLVFADARLVGVACEPGEMHGSDRGRWFIEAAFGMRQQPRTSFANLDEIRAWASGEGRRVDAAPSPLQKRSTGA